MSQRIDLIGQRFSRLKVIGDAGSVDGRAAWLCECDCGNRITTLGKSLRSGLVRSCSCLQKDKVAARNYRHGHKHGKVYRAWTHIKGRCLNSKDQAYANYGARGIGIDPIWQDDFLAFYVEVGEPTSPEMTIERIDNERGYVRGNIRWATRYEQTRNTRRNVRVNVAGQEMVLTDACAFIGLDHRKVAHQMRRGLGWQEAIAAVSA